MNAAELVGLIGNGVGVVDIACPTCGRERRSAANQRRRVLRIWRGADDFVTWCCARCGTTGHSFGERKRPRDRIAFEAAQREMARRQAESGEADRIAYVRKRWREAVDPRGTLAEVYLAGRGLALPAELCRASASVSSALPVGADDRPGPHRRLHSNRRARPGRTACCTVAQRPDRGRQEARQAQGARPGQGRGNQIDADEDVTRGLGISQGLEDALDVRQRGWQPIWCVSGDGAISAFPPNPAAQPDDLPDADASGLRAALACARRWKAAKLEVTIIPPAGAKDWNEAGR